MAAQHTLKGILVLGSFSALVAIVGLNYLEEQQPENLVSKVLSISECGHKHSLVQYLAVDNSVHEKRIFNGNLIMDSSGNFFQMPRYGAACKASLNDYEVALASIDQVNLDGARLRVSATTTSGKSIVGTAHVNAQTIPTVGVVKPKSSGTEPLPKENEIGLSTQLKARRTPSSEATVNEMTESIGEKNQPHKNMKF